MVFRGRFAEAMGGTNKHSWTDAKLSREMGTEREKRERDTRGKVKMPSMRESDKSEDYPTQTLTELTKAKHRGSQPYLPRQHCPEKDTDCIPKHLSCVTNGKVLTFKVGKELKQEVINTLESVVQTENKVCQKIQDQNTFVPQVLMQGTFWFPGCIIVLVV